MSLQFTILPASTNAGKATIRSLLELAGSDFTVQGVYRDISKAPSEFTNHPRFTALAGDVSKGESLDFSGSDAVFYCPPPPSDASTLSNYATSAATNVKEALVKASVKRLVLLSSMGSQYDHGIGILALNHLSDQVLKDSVPEVVVVKPGYFQENWAHVFESTKQSPPVIYSTITPNDHKIPMVSIRDVGVVSAQKLLEVGKPLPSSPFYFDLFGPRNYSADDMRAAVAEVTGKPVEIAAIPVDGLAAFYSESVPEDHVPGFVEMTTAALPGGIMAGDFVGNEHTVHGKEDIVATLRRLQDSQ